MSVKEAAELLGVGRPALSNLLNGKASLSPRMAMRLEKAFGVKAADLMEVQAHYAHDETRFEGVSTTTKSFVPPFLQINSREIETWSRSIGARSRLAVLLRTLVNSTGRALTFVEFPGNEESQRPGWDGRVEAGEGTPWIPKGNTGWEFGCNEDPQQKANKDYKQRLKLDEDERVITVFIFVTPRRWLGKDSWVQAKRKEAEFKDVRAYDASDLEQWLEQSIVAQAWFNYELGRDPCGAKSLDECWTIWLADCKPALSKELFNEAISINSKTMDAWLDAPDPKQLVITADSNEEALAYLSASFDTEDHKGACHRDQVVVISDAKTSERLVSKRLPHFIPIFIDREAEKVFAPFADKAKSIAIYPRNALVADVTDIALDSLSSSSWRDGLTAMGCNRDTINHLSDESGNSLTVLRRRLARTQSVRTPPWADDVEAARKLTRILFAGIWKLKPDYERAPKSVDEEILCLLADVDKYETIEQNLAELAQLVDTPVWSIGDHRGIVSKIDVLFSVNHFVSGDQLQRFFDIADLVLKEDDPSLELPEDKRWMANVYGKVRQISPTLRESIAESLVLLAVHGNSLFRSRLNIDCEIKAALIIRELLTPVSARNWELHSNDLPMYAEAAPDEFLSIIEHDLKSESPTIYGLLRPAGSALFSGRPPRTGLLWALEGLAWSPEYLPRVCLVLARMSEVHLDDNWVNKPLETLNAIFRYWMPQTSANLNERLGCLRLVCDKFPECGWKICFEQFSLDSRVGHYSHKPKWRSDGRGHGEPVGGIERRDFALNALEIAINWKQHNKDTLSDLAEAYWGLPEDTKTNVRNLIDDWSSSNPSDEDKSFLQETIRVHLLGRRGARAAGKSPSKDEGLMRIYDLLRPSDPIHKHSWLFRKSHVLEGLGELEENYDYRQREEKIQELRINALQEIYNQRSTEGIHKLAAIGDAPGVIGWILSKAFQSTEELLDILTTLYEGDLAKTVADQRRLQISSSAFYGMREPSSRKELLVAAKAKFPSEQFFSFLLAAPFNSESWLFVDEMPEADRKRYWREVRPRWDQQGKDDLERAVREFMCVHRPRAGFNVIHLEMKKINAELLYELLQAMASSSQEKPGTFQFQTYEISKAFEQLSASGVIPPDQLAGLEFVYIDALEHGDHGIPNLEKAIETHPGLFSQAIAFAFRRKEGDDGEDPEDWQLDDQDQISRRAVAADSVLDKISRIPGTTKSGVISEIRLNRWVHDVRKICQSLGRLEVADTKIGQVLANSPADGDNIWPCKAVRDVLEIISSKEIGKGLYRGVVNSRGAHWRDEGGDQERELSARFDGYAKKLRTSHPYVSKVLDSIAKSYTRDAEREDTQSSIRKRLRG